MMDNALDMAPGDHSLLMQHQLLSVTKSQSHVGLNPSQVSAPGHMEKLRMDEMGGPFPRCLTASRARLAYAECAPRQVRVGSRMVMILKSHETASIHGCY